MRTNVGYLYFSLISTYKPVKSDVPAEKPKHFMKIKFSHKGIGAINLPQLLRSYLLWIRSLLTLKIKNHQ